jgi:DnaJ family protein C protein 28
LVEDLIQESISRGDFNNLKGQGQPLNQSSTYNPYIDFTTHKLNQVLIENGFAPEWIMLEKEIRQEIKKIRRELSYMRHHRFGETLTQAEEAEWNAIVQEQFKQDCDSLNKMILKFNLTVPSLHKQMITFQLDKEAKKAVLTFSQEIQEAVKNGQVEVKMKTRSKISNTENKNDSGGDSLMGMLMSIFKT